MFVSSADMNLLLLIAPELRLAPLHALHDTSIMLVLELSRLGNDRQRTAHAKFLYS